MITSCDISISFSISLSWNYIMFSYNWKLIDCVFWILTVSAVSNFKNRSETTVIKSNFHALEPWLNLQWPTISVWWMIQTIHHFCSVALSTFACCVTLVLNNCVTVSFFACFWLFKYTVWNYCQAKIFDICVSVIWDTKLKNEAVLQNKYWKHVMLVHVKMLFHLCVLFLNSSTLPD